MKIDRSGDYSQAFAADLTWLHQNQTDNQRLADSTNGLLLTIL